MAQLDRDDARASHRRSAGCAVFVPHHCVCFAGFQFFVHHGPPCTHSIGMRQACTCARKATIAARNLFFMHGMRHAHADALHGSFADHATIMQAWRGGSAVGPPMHGHGEQRWRHGFGACAQEL